MRPLACVVAALICAASAHAQPRVFLNLRGHTVTPAVLVDDLPAFQHAVSADFAPYWHTDAALTLVPTPGDWTVTVTDQPGPCSLFGCVLGYHAVGHHGVPYAVVYAATSADVGVPWETVLTHELFEMLADPWTDRGELRGGKWRILEVCDPVAAFQFTLPSATGRPVPIADFVTPAWFRPHSEGRYDLLQKLAGPLELGSGGYMSVWDPATGGWQTIF